MDKKNRGRVKLKEIKNEGRKEEEKNKENESSKTQRGLSTLTKTLCHFMQLGHWPNHQNELKFMNY